MNVPFLLSLSWCSKKCCYPASRQVPTPTNIPSTDSDENVPVPMSTVEETEWKDDTEVPLSSGLQDVSRLKLGNWDWEMTVLELFSGFRKRLHVSRTSWVEIDLGEDKNNRCKEMILYQYYSYYCPVVFTFFWVIKSPK